MHEEVVGDLDWITPINTRISSLVTFAPALTVWPTFLEPSCNN